MTALTGDRSHGSFVLSHARIAVLGYDADARDYALALASVGNHVTVGLEHAGPCWTTAQRDGFPVVGASAAVEGASVVVVVVRDREPIWRACRPHVEPGALVVVGCAFALETGVFDDGAADVVLVTGYHDGRIARCRVAVHRDLTGRALLRAIGYAHAVFGTDALIEATSVSCEVDRELAAVAERVGSVLAVATAHEPDTDQRERVSVVELVGVGRGLA